MGEEPSDGDGAATKTGWGDNRQQNGWSRPCLLVTGCLPSGHGAACRSPALEAAACLGHPQITSSPAPAPLQEREGAQPSPAGSGTPAGESGTPVCRAGGAGRKCLCKSQHVPRRGGPLPLSAPPAVCGASPAWVWHEERLRRRKDALNCSAHPGAARQEQAPVLAAREPPSHGSPLAPNLLTPPGICPCNLSQHPPTGRWGPGDPAPAAAASPPTPQGAAWPAATFLHPDSAGRPDKRAIRGFRSPWCFKDLPRLLPLEMSPGEEERQGMKPRAKLGPAPARGWGRGGLALGKQHGEPHVQRKAAGCRQLPAARRAMPAALSHTPEAPARPTLSPGIAALTRQDQKAAGAHAAPRMAEAQRQLPVPAWA